jgi:hypothetical protein
MGDNPSPFDRLRDLPYSFGQGRKYEGKVRNRPGIAVKK